MIEIRSKEELEKLKESREHRIIYVGDKSCSVCIDLYPKVEGLLSGYPKLKCYRIEYSDFPEVKSQLSVYTVPAILGYIDGKEFIREARFISLEDLKKKIDRYYEFL